MSRAAFAIGLGLAAVVGLGGLVAHRASRPAESPPRMDAARLTRSIDYFDQALARDPDNPLLKGQIINRLILRFGKTAELADLERAEALAASAIRLASDRSAALARLSGVQLMQHEFAAALDAAQRGVVADSGSAEARGALLEAALAAGRYEVADAMAATLDQGTVSGQVRRALWLDAQGRTETALRLMDQACRELAGSASDPEVTAWCLTQTAGMVHSVRGPAAAEELFQRALTVDPDNRGAVEGLANLAMARGDHGLALERFRSIISAAHPDLYLRLAELYLSLGMPDSAAAAERRFLELAGPPEREPLFGNLVALFLAERGAGPAADSALAIARREVARRPTTESFDLLSWVHYRRGDLDAALVASDRATRWGSPNPTVCYHRGRILAAVGRVGEADRVGEAAELMAAATAIPTLLAPHARADWRRLGLSQSLSRH